jgi:hypothetical protein
MITGFLYSLIRRASASALVDRACRGYLADLTAAELARERKLSENVLAFFVSLRERCGLASELAESFENSWTVSPGDIEAMVPIN